MADMDTEGWKGFGEWLQALRHQRGLRRTEAAERAGVSTSTLANLEKGGRIYRGEWMTPSPDDHTLAGVGRVYGIRYSEMCERVGREPKPGFDVDDIDRRASILRHPFWGDDAEADEDRAAQIGELMEILRNLEPEDREFVERVVLYRELGAEEEPGPPSPNDEPPLDMAAEGVDLDELREGDPEAYEQLVEMARLHLRRLRERREG